MQDQYVKPMLTYHGGKLFGKSVNDESKIAKTVFLWLLVFMVVQLFLLKCCQLLI